MPIDRQDEGTYFPRFGGYSPSEQEFALTVVVESRLDELAAIVAREHEATKEALGEALNHAILAGEALLEARGQMHRTADWMAWMRESLPEGLTPSTACTYMRFAEHKQALLENRPTSKQAAVRLLQNMGLYLTIPPGLNRAEDLKDEAIRLRRKGMSRKAVADALDITPASIWYWENPEKARESKGRITAARKALKREEREREAKRLARIAGGSIAKLYASSERMQDELANARAQVTDREAREALERAGEHYRKMRDQIVQALGVS